MEINDIDFLQLVPAFMKDDEAVQGLSKGVDATTKELSAKIKLLTTWNQIDAMSNAELDMLAEELHISWYDKTAVLDVKRKLIKESDMVHAKMGTNWAVQNVIETYFGSGEIVDWFDYDGEPFHFKVMTSNQSVTEEAAEKFLSILDKVKRKSAWLDSIEIVADGQCNINVFLLSVETETVTSTLSINNSKKYSYDSYRNKTYDELSHYTYDELGGK